MKIRKLLQISLTSLMLTSCTPVLFYQVYQVKKVDEPEGNYSDKKMLFEDANCEIRYNFWGEGGNIPSIPLSTAIANCFAFPAKKRSNQLTSTRLLHPTPFQISSHTEWATQKKARRLKQNSSSKA